LGPLQFYILDTLSSPFTIEDVSIPVAGSYTLEAGNPSGAYETVALEVG
jgi:hypothetical protein